MNAIVVNCTKYNIIITVDYHTEISLETQCSG